MIERDQDDDGLWQAVARILREADEADQRRRPALRVVGGTVTDE